MDSADAKLAVGRGAAREGLAMPLVSGVLEVSSCRVGDVVARGGERERAGTWLTAGGVKRLSG